MQKFKKDWTRLDKINFLQRKIIINCILYYELDNSMISDMEYKELCEQLIDLMNGENIGTYSYAFRDFSVSTGYDLCYNLNNVDKTYLHTIAQHLVGQKTISDVASCVPEKKKKGALF